MAEQLSTSCRETHLRAKRLEDSTEQADLRPFTADVVLAAVGEPKCCGSEPTLARLWSTLASLAPDVHRWMAVGGPRVYRRYRQVPRMTYTRAAPVVSTLWHHVHTAPAGLTRIRRWRGPWSRYRIARLAKKGLKGTVLDLAAGTASSPRRYYGAGCPRLRCSPSNRPGASRDWRWPRTIDSLLETVSTFRGPLTSVLQERSAALEAIRRFPKQHRADLLLRTTRRC